MIHRAKCPNQLPISPEVIETALIPKKHLKRRLKAIHLHSRFDCVPLDVAIMVAEHVCPVNYTSSDVENTCNMLLAFQWTLPDWFWQRRCKQDLVFELDELRKDGSLVDWQALSLDVMSLLADREWFTSSGLGNRQRVLNRMIEIKRAFHATR